MRPAHLRLVASLTVAAIGAATAVVGCTGSDPVLTGDDLDGSAQDRDGQTAPPGEDGGTGTDDAATPPEPPPAVEDRVDWAFHQKTTGQLIIPTAVASDGYSVIVQQYTGTNDGLPAAESRGAFAIILIDKTGRTVWKRGFVGTVLARIQPTGVAFDDAGDIYVAGYASSGATFGNGVVLAPGSSATSDVGFIARFARNDGEGKWLKSFTCDDGGQVVFSAFALRGDTIILAGSKAGGAMKWELAGGDQTTTPVDDSLYVASVNRTDGKARWVRSFRIRVDGGYIADTNGVAIDAAGNVYLGGSFRGTYSGLLTLSAIGSGVNGFVASLDPAGKLRWERAYGSPGTPNATTVNALALGPKSLAVGGIVASGADFGDGAPVGSNGTSDAYLASFDPVTGKPRWKLVVGGPDGGQDGEAVYGVAVDRWDQVVGVGDYRTAFTVGSKVLPTPPDLTNSPGFPSRALFGLKADASGNAVWSKAIVAVPFASGRGVTATPDGAFVIGAAINGRDIELGPGVKATTGTANYDLGALGWSP